MRMRVRWEFLLEFVSVLCLAAAVPAASHAQANSAHTQLAAVKAAPAATAPAKPVAVEAEAKEAGDHGLNTGIKVHGHWVIEVRNPDGKLASHTEFENSLQTSGQSILALLLSGQVTQGDWQIVLDSNSAQPPCLSPHGGGSTGGSPCAFVGAGFSGICINVESTYQCINTLKISPPPPGNSGFSYGFSGTGTSFTLSGTATASVNGVIDTVETDSLLCGNNTAPTSCISGMVSFTNYGAFTSVTLPATGSGQCGGANQPSCAVPVSAGQSIYVSVTISFQ